MCLVLYPFKKGSETFSIVPDGIMLKVFFGLPASAQRGGQVLLKRPFEKYFPRLVLLGIMFRYIIVSV